MQTGKESFGIAPKPRTPIHKENQICDIRPKVQTCSKLNHGAWIHGRPWGWALHGWGVPLTCFKPIWSWHQRVLNSPRPEHVTEVYRGPKAFGVKPPESTRGTIICWPLSSFDIFLVSCGLGEVQLSCFMERARVKKASTELAG